MNPNVKPQLTYEQYKDLRKSGSPLEIRQALDEQQERDPIINMMLVLVACSVVVLLVKSLQCLITYTWILSPSKKLLVNIETIRAKRIVRKQSGWQIYQNDINFINTLFIRKRKIDWREIKCTQM